MDLGFTFLFVFSGSVSVGVPGVHGGIGASPHLLSTSPCSSPFQVCPLSPPEYTCSRSTHPLHRYSNPPEPFPPPRGPSAYESDGFCSLPLPASQLGYLSNPTPQGYAGLRLHTPPYSLYGYTFPPSPRLAASPDKMAAAATANHQSPFLGSSPSGTLTDSLGVLSGGQQGFLFDSRTLGLAGSQPGGGTSQVTAHMGWIWLRTSRVVTKTKWHPGMGVSGFWFRTFYKFIIYMLNKHRAELWTNREEGQIKPLPLWALRACQSFFNWREYFYQVLIFQVCSLGSDCAAAVFTKGRNVPLLWIRSPNNVTQWLSWNWIWIGHKLGWPRLSKQALQPLSRGPEAVTIILTQYSTLLPWSRLLWMELLNTTFKLVFMGYIDFCQWNSLS